MDHLKINASLERVRAPSASSKTPTASKINALLMPEIKTTRNKPDLQIKPKHRSFIETESEKAEVRSDTSSVQSGHGSNAREEHREFQQLFAKFARKVTRLQKAAQEYLNDGAPKRMRQEHKHYSYMFASTLGDFPKLASDDAIDRFVKKMRRFRETTINLVKTCDDELNRFNDQNYYRNDMLVPPLKTLKILQTVIKNAKSARNAKQYEQDKQDIKISKRSLFSMAKDFTKSPSPSKATPDIASPPPPPKVIPEIVSPPPQQLKQNQIAAEHKTKEQEDDTLGSIFPPLIHAEDEKSIEEDHSIEEPKEQQKKGEDISLPMIDTSSVLVHSQSFIEHEKEAKRQQMLEELKEDVFAKYAAAMGQSVKDASPEIKSGFNPANASIEVNPELKSEISQILDSYKGVLSYREEESMVTILAYSKHYLSSATSKINKFVLHKQQQQYQYDLSEEQAMHLKAVASRGNYFYEKIFPSLKVSEVVQDPSTRSYLVIYRCLPNQKKSTSNKILDALSRLRKTSIKLSRNLEYLLRLPDMTTPDISTLHKFEHLHRTILVPRESIPNEDFLIFPSFEPTSEKKQEMSCDEVFHLKAEDPEAAEFSEFYALSSSMKDSSGFVKEMRSQLEYWERYKLTVKEPQSHSLDELIGHEWDKTESGRALQERYSVLLYRHPKKQVAIYGNFNQQRLVHFLITQKLTQETHKELIEISTKSFTTLQGAPRKQIEAKLSQNFPEAKLYFHQSRDGRFWATVSMKDNKHAQIAKEVFKKLELDMMGKVEYEVLSSEYWSERYRLKEFILGNELQLHVETNESTQDKEVMVSRPSGQALWMRSHIGPREEQEFELYSSEMCQKIDWKYRLLQLFFKIEDSTFSIVPGREETWSEISPVNQYKIKRIALQRGILPERIQTLKPREHLIMGRKEEMESLRSVLQSLKHQPETTQGVSLYVQAPLSIELVLHLEKKYKVGLSLDYGTNTVTIEGLLQQEALGELKQYWSFVGRYPRSLKSTGNEKQYIVDLFLSRWTGKGNPQEIEVLQISEPEKWHNYWIEKAVHEKHSPKKDIEQAVFQQDEEEEQYAKKLFQYNLRAKAKQIGKRKSVVLFYILTGKKLKSKEVREMLVPPTKASVKKSVNQSIDLSCSFDAEQEKKVYYDSVEFKTLVGSLFRVFNRNHIYPTYKITFLVHE